MGNIININNGQTAEFPWAASEPIKLTFNVAGFNSLGWAPHGTAIIEYYDPFSNEILVKSVPIGGSRYATEVSVVTGSLNGEGIGAVKITVTDNQDYVTPVSNLPVAQIPEILKTILKQASVIDKVVSGNFSSSGYTVSEIGFESAAEFELSAYVDYAPGFLESKGITPDNLPDGFKAKFDYFGNFTGVEFEEDDDEVIETNGEENEKCFAAGTQIDMADGTQKPIETIQVGDKVMAYDPAENAGRGGLKPADGHSARRWRGRKPRRRASSRRHQPAGRERGRPVCRGRLDHLQIPENLLPRLDARGHAHPRCQGEDPPGAGCPEPRRIPSSTRWPDRKRRGNAASAVLVRRVAEARRLCAGEKRPDPRRAL